MSPIHQAASKLVHNNNKQKQSCIGQREPTEGSSVARRLGLFQWRRSEAMAQKLDIASLLASLDHYPDYFPTTQLIGTIVSAAIVAGVLLWSELIILAQLIPL